MAWIAMAGVDDSVLTALALTVMAGGALDAVRTAARRRCPRRRATVLTRTAVGLYAGWVTAGFFLNLATAAVPLDLAGAAALPWQVVVLGAATVGRRAVLVLTRGVVAYAAAGVWALVATFVARRYYHGVPDPRLR